MHINDCEIDGIDAVSSAPLVHCVPEPEWEEATTKGEIPQSLFDLYRRSSFMSFGAAPPYLSDPENALFGYFGILMRGIKQNLVEAAEHSEAFSREHLLTYDPIKAFRGEMWEKEASDRANRHFRDLLGCLSASLDVMADLVALFLTGSVSRLRVGHSQFSELEHWAKKPPPAPGVLMTPRQYYAHQLHEKLSAIIVLGPPETDWLPMMRLLRNKVLHFGKDALRQIGLHRKSDGVMFSFLSREWPHMWERLIKPAGASKVPMVSMRPIIVRSFMFQDVDSYQKDLLRKVKSLIGDVLSVLNDAYEQLRNMPLNTDALDELNHSFERFDFESFV